MPLTNEDKCSRNDQRQDEERGRGIPVEGIDPAVRKAIGAGREAVVTVGESIAETLRAVRAARESVVMVRLGKDSLNSIDDLVACGLTRSRSEAAAFLISEGIKARADLYARIAEQSEVIRKAREQLRTLLDEEQEAQAS